MSKAREVDGIIEEANDAFHGGRNNIDPPVCITCGCVLLTNKLYCSKCDVPPTPPASVLTEAASLISGERRDSYGTVEESFARVARTWSDILKCDVTPQKVALCMIALKLHREANSSKRDNRVDICGYAALLDQLHTNNSNQAYETTNK